MSNLPREILSVADARALEACAARYETPCGDGRMIWHAWGDGAPIVLLHGGSGSWAHWARNIPALVSAGRRVYAPDMPGCGESDRPPTGEDGDALPPWIETGAVALGLDTFDLVGFSFGAMVAGFYAASFPSRVKRLVLVGAPGFNRTPGPKANLKEWLRLPDGPEREAAFRHNIRALMVARDETVDDLSLTLYVEALKQDRLTKRRIAATDVSLDIMPQIRCPVWGVWGADDVLYRNRRDVAEYGMRQAPDLREIEFVPHAGHWVQYEEWRIFDALLARWLA
ncbi:MAG: alpha/beta hydrolase [Beijerinckiaceae bacterium]